MYECYFLVRDYHPISMHHSLLEIAFMLGLGVVKEEDCYRIYREDKPQNPTYGLDWEQEEDVLEDFVKMRGSKERLGYEIYKARRT